MIDAAVVWTAGQTQDARGKPDRRQWGRDHARQSGVAHEATDRRSGASTQSQAQGRANVPAETQASDHLPSLSGAYYITKMLNRF